jgi:hypothetical protein
MSDLFLHNWVDSVEVATSWETDITTSVNANGVVVEQRRAILTERPRRTIKVKWLCWDRYALQLLIQHLYLSCKQEQEIPLYQDVSHTTATSSGVTINCPTANRRFYVGHRVAIHAKGIHGAENVQFRTIGAVAASTITVTIALTGSFVTGAKVYPVITAHQLLVGSGNPRTDSVFEVDATFEEVLGPNSIQPAEADGTTPSEFDGYPDVDGDNATYPAFFPEADWNPDLEQGYVRVGTRQALGRASQVDAQGDFPAVTVKYTFTFLSRDEFWPILKFFDSRRGRLNLFWVMVPLVFFEFVSNAADSVTLRPVAGLVDEMPNNLSYLMLRLVDGTVVPVAAGTTVDNLDGTWTVFTNSDLSGVASANVVACTQGILARFAEDSLEETWVTDGVGTVVISVQELPGLLATRSFGFVKDEGADVCEQVAP